MKKWFIVGGLLLLILVGGILLSKALIGDVRPAIVPSVSQVSNEISDKITGTTSSSAGKELSFNATLPLGLGARIFADNLAGIRDLELSGGGTLVGSQMGAGRIVALPDKNKDGVADATKVLVSGLSRPHGIVFYKDKLFVAEETKVTRYFWDEEKLEARMDQKILDLPKGGNHFTRDLVFDSKGQLFISLGSTCNVCVEADEWLAAVIVTNENGDDPRLFAKGLRNSVFLTINPGTDEIWAGDMGRDLIGDNVPPEEINILRQGKHYGWPFCYGNKILDSDFGAQQKDNPEALRSCEITEAPVYGYQAHSAPLGITFIDSPLFPEDYQGDLLVAYHGSWNRSAPVGYKVVRFKVNGNTIEGDEDFMTGFLKGTEAAGRPVDLVMSENALYISDDKAGAIYQASRTN